MRTKVADLLVAATLGASALFAAAAPAQGAASDPLFVFVPVPAPFSVLPPPVGSIEGPCGMGVDPAGRFYVSDYYHHVIDIYDQNADYTTPPPPGKPPTGATGYLGQLAGVDPLDGPCGLAFDASGNLYVNDYHRAVIRYGAFGSFGAGQTITGAALDETHPTGVAVDPSTGNVYVDQRTHVSVYDSSGAAVIDGSGPLRIGEGSLQDGYGIAFSQFPGTAGRLYVPDAGTDTVRVYDPAADKDDPVAEIDGADTPNGKFVSLRDAAVAVDRVTGEIYVLDNLQPEYTDKPQAVVYVFSSAGAYEGHLKSLVTDALPAGLAVDNSAGATQGRVYVTSGNSSSGAIHAYGPGAATTAPLGLSSLSFGSEAASGRTGFSAQGAPQVPQGAPLVAVPATSEGIAVASRRQAKPRKSHRRHRAHRHQRQHREAGANR